MPVHIDWYDIALRIALALIAGILVGLDRGERAKPAGLRTTVLVCLAAAVAMVLTNLLITTRGRPVDSFVQFDIMRIPLGILSGIGFIGAGTILKKGDIVQGVTTAATVWFVTVIGLCFGAGQLALGIVASILALLILWALRWVEYRLPTQRKAILFITCNPNAGPGITEEEIYAIIYQTGGTIASCGITYGPNGHERGLRCDIRWRGRAHENRPPNFLQQVAARPGVHSVRWNT